MDRRLRTITLAAQHALLDRGLVALLLPLGLAFLTLLAR